MIFLNIKRILKKHSTTINIAQILFYELFTPINIFKTSSLKCFIVKPALEDKMKCFLFKIAIIVIMCTSLNAQWEILNEGVKGDIKTMDFISEKTGWAAGYGTLLKTEDGGRSWFSLTNNFTLSDIKTIDFVNDSVGWMLGFNFLVKTQDGGKTWDDSPWGFDAIYPVNDSVVYAVGYNILKSTDGGEYWQIVNSGSKNRNITSGWFFNNEIGIVIGNKNEEEGVILRTFNGGKTWDERVFPEFEYIGDLQFINDSTGYFLADNNSGKYVLCITTDTLNTYSVLSTGDDRRINAYHFLDKNTAYATMYDSSRNVNVMKSLNGGVTWEQTLIYPNLRSYIISSNGMNTVFLFNTTKNVVTQNGRFYLSQAGIVLHRNIKNENQWATPIWSYPLLDVTFLNKDLGIAVGGWWERHSRDGGVFMTSNGGKTWDIIFNSSDMVRACTLINDSIGFTLEGDKNTSALYKTTNSGKDWNEVIDLGTEEYHWSLAQDIFFINENIGWVLGGNSEQAFIFNTKDGGEKMNIQWQYPKPADYQGNYFGLSSVYFVSDTTGWAVGEAGLMVKYAGQEQWQAQTRVTDLPLNDVFFSDDNHGWITGGYLNEQDFQSILLKTINGGANWQEISIVDYLINDIFFENNMHGWAVGTDTSYHGMVLKTEDGGNNWNIQEDGLIAPLNAIDFTDGYGWAVGELGLGLRTDDGSTWIDQNSGKTYPNKFSLSQNYPNPFNPNTTIKYQLKTKSNVQLTIYDISGREVKTLINQRQNAGHHSVAFDASDFASGIYFYRLKTSSGFVQSRKMVLLR